MSAQALAISMLILDDGGVRYGFTLDDPPSAFAVIVVT